MAVDPVDPTKANTRVNEETVIATEYEAVNMSAVISANRRSLCQLRFERYTLFELVLILDLECHVVLVSMRIFYRPSLDMDALVVDKSRP